MDANGESDRKKDTDELSQVFVAGIAYRTINIASVRTLKMLFV